MEHPRRFEGYIILPHFGVHAYRSSGLRVDRLRGGFQNRNNLRSCPGQFTAWNLTQSEGVWNFWIMPERSECQPSSGDEDDPDEGLRFMRNRNAVGL